MNSKMNLLIGLLIGSLLGFGAFTAINDPITGEQVGAAANILGLNFTSAERDSMISMLNSARNDYKTLRELRLDNGIAPSMQFNPIPLGKTFDSNQKPLVWDIPATVELPQNRDDLAFYTVAELSSLIKSRKISVVELTQFFLKRIEMHNPKLEAIVSVTEERAMKQARQLDEELSRGVYRGPLHGIPYGAKDLLAVPGYKTTWGAMPYKDQVRPELATVIKKLDEAGAVLVAKTTLGALAYGDIWFGGRTNNPWNLEQGSSGSSAGSASGVSAGLFPFAIGTETLGSIVSPATRNGATGLRPTYGRVSRYGAMALSWSMDKIGPLTRSVEDLALVFHTIHGSDPLDPTVYDFAFNYNANLDITKLRIGYIESAFERDNFNKERDNAVLETLRSLGVDLIPIELPEYPVGPLRLILTAEGAAAFEEITLDNTDDTMRWQTNNAWPNTFRAARFIPAVEYLQANRARTVLIQKMDSLMQTIDVYVSPSFANSNLLITNLTGHPSVVLPHGFTQNGTPTSITFMGKLFGEAEVLSVAKAYQEATTHHKKHPPLFSSSN